MEISTAREFVNRNVNLCWTDRTGSSVSATVFIYEVNFVPFYGPCLITSNGDIRLDRIEACDFAAEGKVA